MTKKDEAEKMHFFPIKSMEDKPPRHAFLCYYVTDKKHSNLFIFDPMTEAQAGRENRMGLWSISILKNLYLALNKPMVHVRYGSSSGSNCLWQSLRKLDMIIHDDNEFKQFTCK